MNRANQRERDKPQGIGTEMPKTFGTHILPPYALDAGYGPTGFFVCIAMF
jgi:hypothetical protein